MHNNNSSKLISACIIFGFMLMVVIMASSAPQPVEAAGGITHKLITDEELANCNTQICVFIKNHYAKFLAGVGWPDVTVPYYYTRFDNYQSTHTWLVYHQCLASAPDDDTKAICYGIGAHLAVDSAYHNYMVPAILDKNFWCFDWLCHPVEEVVIENTYIDMRGDEGGFMSAMDDDDVKFLNKLVGKPLDAEVALLKDVYGKTDFYSSGYGGSSGASNWKYEAYKLGVNGLSNPIFKLAFLDVDTAEVMTTNEIARNNLREVFNGRTPPVANPTGAEAIRVADSWLGSQQLKASILMALLLFSIVLFILNIWKILKYMYKIIFKVASVPKAVVKPMMKK